MDLRLLKTAVATTVSAVTLMANVIVMPAAVAGERIDYDLDDDGLIEIESLQDLNEIRNNFTLVGQGEHVFKELKGNTLYGSSDGCPDTGCKGYELVSDLNFDTNGNGELDSADEFWNDGKGWDPIGSFSTKLVTEFNGNGHTLHNFVMRRPGETFLGLFAYSELSHIHDFSITGDLITGAESGGLMGYSWRTHFENIHAELSIVGEAAGDECQSKCVPSYLGGIVGIADESDFNNILLKINVSGLDRLGGLAGQVIGDGSNHIRDVAMQGDIRGDDFIGGLVGYLNDYKMDSIVVVAQLNGHQAVGGIVGESETVTINNALVSGSINADAGVTQNSSGGGVLGGAGLITLKNVISTMRMPSLGDTSIYSMGAIVSFASNRSSINSVYWAKDLSLRNNVFGRNAQPSYEQNFDLIDLQCADANENCNGAIFDGFGLSMNSQGQALWDFGTDQETPVMALASMSFGDRDGDGEIDDWPVIAAPVCTESCNTEPSLVDNDSDSSKGIGSLFYLLLMLPLFISRRNRYRKA
jgi:hypothetical protein